MRNVILFIDSGDTLVDEGTQVWDGDIVLRADLIPGAAETVKALHEAGYPIALVADGLNQSFENVYAQHRLRGCFDAWIVSETVGVHKPDARMFQAAMDALGLGEADKDRIVMVGNNLKRDVLGANRFGIRSALLDWSPRYPHEPESPEETPWAVIHSPRDLPGLLERLSRG